jgi:4-amino-4-deoxy-L-arabinose transferase-like glycosyltransferase
MPLLWGGKLPMRLTLFKRTYALLLIVFFAIFIRFVGISWGLPFPFHPDEWNMAASVSQLSWQEKLNPHFFAYGQFPLYLTYFSAKVYNLLPWIHLKEITVNEAIFFLRFWSAVAGVLSVILIYLVTRKLLPNNLALWATLIATFTPSLIQNSHFGTTESILTLGFLGIVYSSLLILEKPRFRFYLLAALFLAMALGSKITAVVFWAPLAFASLFQLLRLKKKEIFLYFLASLTLALTLTCAFSPYLLLNFDETKRIIAYEAQVATGKIPVFYTRQFIDTSPILFQFQKVFPYALGWPIMLLGGLGVIIAILGQTKTYLKKQKINNINGSWLVIVGSFMVYFFSQAFLFTKWTRFMAPIFPFFAVFSALAVEKIAQKFTKGRFLVPCLVSATIAIIPGVIFSSIYLKPDIRFVASEWIFKNIPSDSKVLSETGNVIDLPILPQNPFPASYHLDVVSFDFYQLDEKPETFTKLLEHLENSDYIFIPSRRIFANHLRLPQKYPLAAKYYALLSSGKLGFKEIKVFQPFSRLVNDEFAEETWTVFDHPTIRVYQKKENWSQTEYEKFFKN